MVETLKTHWSCIISTGFVIGAFSEGGQRYSILSHPIGTGEYERGYMALWLLKGPKIFERGTCEKKIDHVHAT
jgi:hypothetical protein